MICSKCKDDKPKTAFYTSFRKDRNKVVTYHECRMCFRIRMNARHEETKLLLVRESGGSCKRCNYNRSPRVLAFHHLDSTKKAFEISERPSADINVLRMEVAKCILLCPTCHAEKHLGLW